MPRVLREIYETFGAADPLTTAHNRLLPPAEHEQADGHVIFYDENQGVVQWAYRGRDAAQDDPIVQQGASTVDGYEWHSEEMALSHWIRVMSFWQLVNGGYPHCAFASDVSDAGALAAAHFPVLPSHADGATRFFGVPGQLTCVAGLESASVWAAAATAAEFKDLCGKLDLEWDYCSDE